MKSMILCAAILLAASASAFASGGKGSDEPFRKIFSLELGTGLQPLHMTLSPSRSEKESFASHGIALTSLSSDLDCPVISISEVWRTRPHWELCLTEGISWKIMDSVQYGTFGTDPSGNPRYDLNNGTPAGTKAMLPVGSLSFQARFIWSPKWKVTVYSALGIGFTTVTEYIPMPLVTPVALRIGGEHFYGFAEATIGPVATFAHGGIGWRF